MGVINHSGGIDSPEGFESCCRVTTDFITGTIRNLDLRSGLNIEIFDQFHHIEFSKNFCVTYPALRIAFYMVGTGGIKTESRYINHKTNIYDIEGGYCTAGFFPELKGIIRMKGKTRFLQVTVNVSPSILYSFMDDPQSAFPDRLKMVVQGVDPQGYYHKGSITPSMQSALYEIINCPYKGVIRKVFMESKALELVAYKLAQIQMLETRSKPRPAIRLNENEKIHHAKDLLLNNMEHPPTLFDLAREVGLSHTKLNKGFKKFYGTTVFGYLQRMRLEHAKYLMEKGGVNVTEAAMAVGYNSIPSFSKAFSFYFKQPPKMSIKNGS